MGRIKLYYGINKLLKNDKHIKIKMIQSYEIIRINIISEALNNFMAAMLLIIIIKSVLDLRLRKIPGKFFSTTL